MASLALALALFLQGQPAAAATAEPAPPAAEDRLPTGAPRDDYQFVGWCYGMLRGYLDLHDQVMPEVTRIESTFRPPDRKLSDDLQVYADMQKEGQKQLKQFRAALTAAEKASLKPINQLGAKAVGQGSDVWRSAQDVTPARLAQEWMSWTLPARCETVSRNLKANATLLGGAFKVNDQPEPPPEATPAEKPAETKEAAAAEAPAPDAKPAGDTPAAAANSDAAPPAEAPADAKALDPAAVLLGAEAPPPAKAPVKRKAPAKGKKAKAPVSPPPSAADPTPEAPAETPPTPQ